MDEKAKLDIIKDILFTDEREFEEEIAKKIEILERTINEKKRLSKKVDPIIERQLEEFTKNIPKTLGPTITATLKEEIKNHKDEVVDALYPVLGKMVKKYVAQEMKLLSEKIDNRLGFIKRWKLKFRAFFTGAKEDQLMLDELSSAKIEQVLLIEKDSGILKASFSKSNTIDEEMISGMLTAIKSFVEDAFNQKNQNLENIEYELYNIQLQSFVTHYIAVVVSGNYGTASKSKLQDLIFDFYHRFMAMNLDLVFETQNSDKKIVPVGKARIERELAQSFSHAKI